MTFILIGRYSSEAIQEISGDRTDRAVALISELGGKVHGMYALLGGLDCALILELPDNATAMRASLGLTVLTGISFSTYPAVSVNDLDRMLGH